MPTDYISLDYSTCIINVIENCYASDEETKCKLC